MINAITYVLRQRNNLSSEFDFHLFKWMPESARSPREWTHMMLQGCDTTTFKSGKRKGQKKYLVKQNNREFILSHDDIKIARQEYEKLTGNCSGCMGEKQTAYSWSATEGTKYRDCKDCGGSGKPSTVDQPVKL